MSTPFAVCAASPTASFAASRASSSDIAVTFIVVPSGNIPSSASTETFIPPALPLKLCAGISDSFMKFAVKVASSSISEGTKVASLQTVLPSASTHATN